MRNEHKEVESDNDLGKVMKIAYNPRLGLSLVIAIRNNIEPLMVSNDGMTGQYSVDSLIELDALVGEDDMKLLKRLKENGIELIEI